MTWYLALGQGVDIIRNNADIALDVSLGWEKFWEATYEKTNGLWLVAIYLSSVVVSFAFLAFTVAFLQSLWTNKYTLAFRHYLWVIIVMWLLSDSGAVLANLALGMRSFALDQTQKIYEIQVAGVAVEEALKDVLITGDIKQQIGAEFRKCEVKTGEAQIQCVVDAGKFAEDKIEEAENQWGPLAGLERLWDRLEKTSSDLANKVKGKSPAEVRRILADPNHDQIILGSVTTATVHLILKICQWGFSNLFELALAMTGLYAPIAAALSTLPLPSRFIWFWLQSYLSVAIAIWSYAVMVGIIAWVIAISETQTVSDIAFVAFIGVFAPCLSWALARGGGTAIWQSATSAFVTVGRILF
jgi:hypothetical protein